MVVCCHLLHIVGDGVRLCQNFTLEEGAEMTTLFQESKMGGQTNNKLSSTNTTMSSVRGSNVELGGGSSRGIIKVGILANIFNQHACDDAIAKLFFGNDIPFNVTCSPFYKEASKKAYVAGASYVPPKEHKMRTTFLDRHYSKVNLLIKDLKELWNMTGCSTVMDG